MSVEFIITEPEWNPEPFLETFKDKKGRIRRPPNAYFVFLKYNRAYVRSRLHHRTNSTLINKTLAILWQYLPDDMRNSYAEHADRLRTLHETMFPTYTYSSKVKKIQKSEERQSVILDVLNEMDTVWKDLTNEGKMDDDGSERITVSKRHANERLVPVFVKLADVQAISPNQKFMILNAENLPTQNVLSNPRTPVLSSERSSKSSIRNSCRISLSLSDYDSCSSPAVTSKETEDFFHGLFPESSEGPQTSTTNNGYLNQVNQNVTYCEEDFDEEHTVEEEIAVVEKPSPAKSRQILTPKRNKVKTSPSTS